MPTAISVSGGTAKSRGDRPKTLFSVDRRARMERVERKGKGDVVDRILETMIRATLDEHITDVVPLSDCRGIQGRSLARFPCHDEVTH